MAVELDELDRTILELLSRDGRTPAAQIAEQVGLSRPAVAERIDKLERAGVLRGTTAVIDPLALGRSVTAFVFAREPARVDSSHARALEELLGTEEVLEMHSVAGDDCYLMKIRTDSIASLNKLVNRLGAPPLRMTTRTTIVMQTHVEKVGGIVLGGAAA